MDLMCPSVGERIYHSTRSFTRKRSSTQVHTTQSLTNTPSSMYVCNIGEILKLRGTLKATSTKLRQMQLKISERGVAELIALGFDNNDGNCRKWNELMQTQVLSIVSNPILLFFKDMLIFWCILLFKIRDVVSQVLFSCDTKSSISSFF
jgi:hypothetical protein